MKPAILISLAALPFTASAVTVDFESLETLNPTFISPRFQANSMPANGVGFAGSRGVSYTNAIVGGGSDVRIYTPIVLHPDTPLWEVSILYRHENLLSQAVPMIGVIGSQYEPDAPGGFVSPHRSVAALFATAQFNSVNLLGSYGSYVSSASSTDPILPSPGWRRLTLSVEHLGTTSGVIQSYSINVSLFHGDRRGSPGPLIAQLTDNFSTVQFQHNPELHAFFGIDTPSYFGWNGPGFTGAIDDFTVNIPEPTTITLGATAALFLLTRRSQSSARL